MKGQTGRKNVALEIQRILREDTEQSNSDPWGQKVSNADLAKRLRVLSTFDADAGIVLDVAATRLERAEQALDEQCPFIGYSHLDHADKRCAFIAGHHGSHGLLHYVYHPNPEAPER